jgi:fructose-bisphosphate aldolase class I
MTTLSPEIIKELQTTITALAVRGKGLLAADESIPTISKRFAALNIPCTEQTRRDYRELLVNTPGIETYIAGVILYEETLTQKTSQGIPFPELLVRQGMVPGIKVDKGLLPLPLSDNSEEKMTQGLDGLLERLLEYKAQGARFAKWRAVYTISENTPSLLAIKSNATLLAQYAAICQTVGIIPIVEPEVLLEGTHSLEDAFKVSERVLHAVFHALHQHNVLLEYIVLKPSMVTSGKSAPIKASAQQIAEATLTVLRRTVPAAVPSINFLSGGQTPKEATENLNAMHQLQSTLPWNLSFSYARALQEPCIKIWLGKPENNEAAATAFALRSKLNSMACFGEYAPNLEA